MPGLSQILEIARRALSSQQMGMNVTGHNISNANTLGYSRQRVDLVATRPVRGAGGLLGTGVSVAHIGRLRDRFVDQQLRISNNAYGNATAQHKILSQVEAAFNEPSDSGLGATMTKFFSSFQDLATHPEESGARTAVLQRGTMLAQTFRRLNTNLTQLRSDMVDDIKTKVARVNVLAQDISALDNQIVAAIAAGTDPSDAKDQRDLKIEELSTLVNVNVGEDGNGSVMVSVAGIVVASRSGPQALSTAMVNGTLQVTTATDGAVVNANGGELGGMLKTHNTDIPSSLAKLDQLAGAIITRMNTLHSAGFGLGTPPPTGNNFFSGTNAADISVDLAIQNDVNNIAASGTGAPGNNDVALALSRVGSEPLLNGNTASVTQFYGSLISEIGSGVSSADTAVRSQELIIVQLQNQRNSVSGVSLDEEMTNLIKFQRSYDAAARVVNTVNELFQTILNMV